MSSDVGCHITEKLRPMSEHGSILLYVHGNHKARSDGQPRTATSTLTQLLNYEVLKRAENRAIYNISDHQSVKRPGGGMGRGGEEPTVA